MTCLAVGNPTSLKHSWTRTLPANSNPPSNTLYDGASGNLTIPNAQLSATGSYNCLISNTVGHIDLLVMLTILGKLIRHDMSITTLSIHLRKKSTMT